MQYSAQWEEAERPFMHKSIKLKQKIMKTETSFAKCWSFSGSQSFSQFITNSISKTCWLFYKTRENENLLFFVSRNVGFTIIEIL